jgi:signal transduction histidine kinase
MNAFKFTIEGSIELGYQKKSSKLEFFVKDTGPGIATDQLEKIFDRFYQSETALHKKTGGTGLGLSICKSFTEILGGSIWVESEIGKGSAFYVSIPITNSLVHK